VRLDTVDADRHPEAPAVDRPVLSRRVSQRLERTGRDECRAGESAAIDAVALTLGTRETDRPTDVVRQRVVPRPLDEAPFHRAAEEARHDALAELDVSDDLAAVGEPKQWVPVDELGPHGEQRRNALPVQERPFIVDEVEATVAPDAGELELDRVDGRETERLDGCDRQPDDLRDGYSTSTWMRFFASFRNPPSR
jgi:hypothetical protein